MLLCNMASLEKDLFVKNVDKFLSRRDENIVIDDELIGSRAQDVETKALSHPTAGKEGPTCDAIACSLTSVLLGV